MRLAVHSALASKYRVRERQGPAGERPPRPYLHPPLRLPLQTPHPVPGELLRVPHDDRLRALLEFSPYAPRRDLLTNHRCLNTIPLFPQRGHRNDTRQIEAPVLAMLQAANVSSRIASLPDLCRDARFRLASRDGRDFVEVEVLLAFFGCQVAGDARAGEREQEVNVHGIDLDDSVVSGGEQAFPEW